MAKVQQLYVVFRVFLQGVTSHLVEGVGNYFAPSGYLLATLLYTSCILLVYHKREDTVFIREVYKQYTRRPYNGYHLQRVVIGDYFGQIRPKQSNLAKMVKISQNGHCLGKLISDSDGSN